MKKKIITTVAKATLITSSLIAAFMIGKSQTEIVEIPTEPKQENYINVDTFEDFYTTETEDGTELHFYANGNEYIFEK